MAETISSCLVSLPMVLSCFHLFYFLLLHVFTLECLHHHLLLIILRHLMMFFYFLVAYTWKLHMETTATLTTTSSATTLQAQAKWFEVNQLWSRQERFFVQAFTWDWNLSLREDSVTHFPVNRRLLSWLRLQQKDGSLLPWVSFPFFFRETIRDYLFLEITLLDTWSTCTLFAMLSVSSLKAMHASLLPFLPTSKRVTRRNKITSPWLHAYDRHVCLSTWCLCIFSSILSTSPSHSLSLQDFFAISSSRSVSVCSNTRLSLSLFSRGKN